jgi:cholesterol transport system auxiliary component
MKNLIVVAAAALVAGCFGGLKNEAPAPRIYRLDAPQFAPGSVLPADLAVVVERVAPGLEGDGIAGRWPDHRVDTIAGARWAGDLAGVLQAALIESFQDSGRLRSVQPDVGRFRATHTLVIQVRRFEADYTAGALPVAQVEFAATLGSLEGQAVLASFTASASESTAENRQATVVAALNAAFARVSTEVAGRTFDAIAADPAQASANISR